MSRLKSRPPRHTKLRHRFRKVKAPLRTKSHSTLYTKRNKSYAGNRKAFVLSLSLHLLLFFSVFMTIDLFYQQRSQSVAVAAQPIKAVAVNEAAVTNMINTIKQSKQLQHQTEQRRQAALRQQANRLQKQRHDSELALKRMQQQLQKLQAKHHQQQAELKHLAAERQAAKQVLEKAKRATVQEQQKAAAIKKKQLAAQQQRDAELAAEASLLTAQYDQRLLAEINRYKSMIKQAISQRWLITTHVHSAMAVRLAIRIAPGGSVLAVNLLQGSGDAALDRAAITAVYKAAPLPVPTEPELFNKFREIDLTMRPESIISHGG